MEGLKPARDLNRKPQDAVHRQAITGFLRARDTVPEGSAGEVTTDHESRFAIFPVIAHGRDVRVVTQLAQHKCFPCAHTQPGRHDRVVGEGIESHFTTQLPIACEINLLVTGRPQEPLNLVPSVPQDVSCLKHLVHAGERLRQGKTHHPDSFDQEPAARDASPRKSGAARPGGRRTLAALIDARTLSYGSRRRSELWPGFERGRYTLSSSTSGICQLTQRCNLILLITSCRCWEATAGGPVAHQGHRCQRTGSRASGGPG